MSGASRSVFISSTTTDRPTAQRIHDALASRGFATWIAPADLAGDELHGAVMRALGTSTDMVLVFSAATNASEDARRELALANQHNLTVIPVRIDGVQPNDHFAYELATATWIDASQNFDAALNQIVASVGAGGVTAGAAAPVVAAAAPPPTAPAQPQVVYAPYPPQKPRSHVLRHVIVTIIVLVVLLFGGLFTWGYFKLKDIEGHLGPCRASGDLDAKIAACSAIADDNFTDKDHRAEAHQLRGKAYLMKKDYAKARVDFDWAISNDGTAYASYYYRSVAERGEGNTTAADADLALATSHGFTPSAADLALAPAGAPSKPATPTEIPPAATTPPADTAPTETPPDTTTPEQPSGDTGNTDEPAGNTRTAPDQTPSPDDGSGDQTSGEGRHH